jgi:hypothetical protein
MNGHFKKGTIIIKLTITGLMILFINLSAYSQENSITGTWKTDFAAIVSEMSPEKKEKYDQLPQEVKERAGKSLNNRTYEFLEDGRLKASWTYDEKIISYTGTWELTAEGDLSLAVGEKIIVYEMVFETTSKVILLPRNNPEGLIFNTLVLNKV